MKNKKHITIEKVILFLAASFAAYNFGLDGESAEEVANPRGGLKELPVEEKRSAISDQRTAGGEGVDGGGIGGDPYGE